MENYYYNLAELPESYNKEQVVRFLGKHNILACEIGNAPRNKHIGSGAWHDDILAFLIENFQQEATPASEFQTLYPVEFFSNQEKEYIESTINLLAEDIVVRVLETTPIQVQMVHGNKKRAFVIENLSAFADTLKIEVAEIKLQAGSKKKSTKKSEDSPSSQESPVTPNSTDNA